VSVYTTNSGDIDFGEFLFGSLVNYIILYYIILINRSAWHGTNRDSTSPLGVYPRPALVLKWSKKSQVKYLVLLSTSAGQGYCFLRTSGHLPPHKHVCKNQWLLLQHTIPRKRHRLSSPSDLCLCCPPPSLFFWTAVVVNRFQGCTYHLQRRRIWLK
jgi:hypothetical protein